MSSQQTTKENKTDKQTGIQGMASNQNRTQKKIYIIKGKQEEIHCPEPT